MAPISRRRLLAAAGIGLVGVGAIAARPGRHGAPHDAYFTGMAKALQQAGIATPTLVIDRKRLHANVQQIVHNIGGRMNLRVVAKSLPSVALIKDVLEQAKTDRLMVFSLPQLLQLAPTQRNILLGKPMPVAAAAAFYRAQPAPLAGQTLASGLYGSSSNQMMLVGSGLQDLAVDDMVFLRPHQSEALLQQFGDIAVLEDGKITEFWKPMPATA